MIPNSPILGIPPPMPGQAIAQPLAQLVGPKYAPIANLPSTYTQSDLTDEAYREVVYADGSVYRINEPVNLVIRKGGATHRVIDAKGVVHCYVAPESGKSTIRWAPRPGRSPIKF